MSETKSPKRYADAASSPTSKEAQHKNSPYQDKSNQGKSNQGKSNQGKSNQGKQVNQGNKQGKQKDINKAEGTQSKMVSSGTQSSARGTRSEPVSHEEKEERDEEKEKEPEQNTDKKEEKKEKKEEKKRSKKKPERKEKVKEFFRAELDRLKTTLAKEGDKIEKPERKDFAPYTFTSLAPYIDVHSLEFLLNYPDEPDLTHTSRNVSLGLTDPWEDFRIDTQGDIQGDEEKKDETKKKKKEKKEEKKEKEERPPKEGSTRLPKFPCVSVEPGEMSHKKISYADVPKLREEIRNKYSKNSDTKVLEEYERTKQDFYRMELDKMEEIHPVNRPHMRAVYFAYLQNNPGSRKAVYDCFKHMGEKKSPASPREEGENGAEEAGGNSTSRANKSANKSKSGSEKSTAKA